MEIVATTSLPAVYRPNDTSRTTTAGMPHARAKMDKRMKQAGTELAQAQYKLGLDFTLNFCRFSLCIGLVKLVRWI